MSKHALHNLCEAIILLLVLAGIVLPMLWMLAGCSLHFHYHGATAAPSMIVETQTGNANDNGESAEERLRDLLGIDNAQED